LRIVFVRLGVTAFALLVAVDILVGNLARAPFYWLTGWEWAKPCGRQTISAVVGHLASKGYRVAIILQDQIDDLLGQGHCETAAAYDDEIAADLIKFGAGG
jgi:hypothetical protein